MHKNKEMRKHLWHILPLIIHDSEADEQINILTEDQNRLSGKTLWKPEYYFWNWKDLYILKSLPISTIQNYESNLR